MRQKRAKIRLLAAVLLFAVMAGSAAITIYGKENAAKKTAANDSLTKKYVIDSKGRFCTIYECVEEDSIYYIVKWVIKGQ